MIAVVALLSAAGHTQRLEHDLLIVPGARVGPINAKTPDDALDALLGPNNVERIDVKLGEGFTATGTGVYPDSAGHRIEIVWTDTARTVPKEVRLTGDSSMWQTGAGISLGSTLREIERLNGFPFRLAGFAFDYAGTIADCGRGRLAVLGCSGAAEDFQPAREGRLMVLRLAPDAAAAAMPEYRQVRGDRIFSSGHPAMQALDPRVYQMVVIMRLGGGE
jgi:hypothetical protein